MAADAAATAAAATTATASTATTATFRWGINTCGHAATAASGMSCHYSPFLPPSSYLLDVA